MRDMLRCSRVLTPAAGCVLALTQCPSAPVHSSSLPVDIHPSIGLWSSFKETRKVGTCDPTRFKRWQLLLWTKWLIHDLPNKLKRGREGHQKFLYFLPELSHLFLTYSPASQSVGLKETRKDGKGMPVDGTIPNGLNPNGSCLIHHNEGWGLEGF